MFFKILLLFFLLVNISSASYKKLRIGKIDDYYKDRISEYELRTIIDEIEYFLEAELNMNIFDYSQLQGKDINIVYVPPSKLEKRIEHHIRKLKQKEKEIKKLQKSFPKKIKDVNKLKKLFTKQNNILNKRMRDLNDYIREVNKKKNVSKSEYNKIQNYVKKQKTKLHIQLKKLKKEQSYVKSVVDKYNKNIRLYNSLIRKHNKYNNELEVMSRNFKKIKGMTFGIKEIRLKTYYKDGKIVKEKNIRNNMNKIDIYGFDSLKELKTILAHEILHLVGIPHINAKNALMNPIIQKNQLEKLSLTREDIINFEKHF
ncbi:matrixin family metalloprotease [Arcobacter sp. LA11]|uniref:matrixin family metalloprotease n=1 Tax=Arcobacter sp. LA11 TaxID=1898176 RepID=UPI000934F5D0|nr:matrixin family metalloprotease [Arcobacter sp. LA11]